VPECSNNENSTHVELITHGRQEVSTGMLDQFVNTRVFAVETPGLSSRLECLDRLELLRVD